MLNATAPPASFTRSFAALTADISISFVLLHFDHSSTRNSASQVSTLTSCQKNIMWFFGRASGDDLVLLVEQPADHPHRRSPRAGSPGPDQLEHPALPAPANQVSAGAFHPVFLMRSESPRARSRRSPRATASCHAVRILSSPGTRNMNSISRWSKKGSHLQPEGGSGGPRHAGSRAPSRA